MAGLDWGVAAGSLAIASGVVLVMEGLMRLRQRRVAKKIDAQIAARMQAMRDGTHVPEPRPPSRWRVQLDGDTLLYADGGHEMRAPLATLTRVRVLTNDQGPFAPDVFWALEFADSPAMLIPQEGDGTGELLDRLTALPGFDHARFIASQASAEVAEFECWSAGATCGTQPGPSIG